jgi:hypothetical protein
MQARAGAEGRAQRAVPVWQRPEVQDVLRAERALTEVGRESDDQGRPGTRGDVYVPEPTRNSMIAEVVFSIGKLTLYR